MDNVTAVFVVFGYMVFFFMWWWIIIRVCREILNE